MPPVMAAPECRKNAGTPYAQVSIAATPGCAAEHGACGGFDRRRQLLQLASQRPRAAAISVMIHCPRSCRPADWARGGTRTQAEELAVLLRRYDLRNHVNVIPWNPVADSTFQRPSNNSARPSCLRTEMGRALQCNRFVCSHVQCTWRTGLLHTQQAAHVTHTCPARPSPVHTDACIVTHRLCAGCAFDLGSGVAAGGGGGGGVLDLRTRPIHTCQISLHITFITKRGGVDRHHSAPSWRVRAAGSSGVAAGAQVHRFLAVLQGAGVPASARTTRRPGGCRRLRAAAQRQREAAASQPGRFLAAASWFGGSQPGCTAVVRQTQGAGCAAAVVLQAAKLTGSDTDR